MAHLGKDNQSEVRHVIHLFTLYVILYETQQNYIMITIILYHNRFHIEYT